MAVFIATMTKQWSMLTCYPLHYFNSYFYATNRYTVRSVMGDYHGYVALFEILPKASNPTEYEYFYTPCSFVHLSIVTITAISSVVWCIITSLYFLIQKICYSNKTKVQ